MTKFIRCSHCCLDVECDGDPGPVHSLRIPGNHEPRSLTEGGYAMPSETAVCPGSEMLGRVDEEIYSPEKPWATH